MTRFGDPEGVFPAGIRKTPWAISLLSLKFAHAISVGIGVKAAQTGIPGRCRSEMIMALVDCRLFHVCNLLKDTVLDMKVYV